MELLALLVVLIVGYAAAGLVYRRYLRRRIPETPSPPESAVDGGAVRDRGDTSVEDGVMCPACGAVNESGFERCFHCANPLPGE